jgi:hypothetical protein
VAAYHPYYWYRCSNLRCRMPTVLPEGMLGLQTGYLPGQAIEEETLAVACSHCNCVCIFTPIGNRAPIPEQVLAKLPHMYYAKLWLRCGHPDCKSLTRLLVHATRGASIEDVKAIIADRKVVGVHCGFGHPIHKAIAA